MIFLALIFGIAAVLWLSILLRHGGIFVGCLLVIATGSVLGHPFFNVSVITLDRLLLGLICVLYFFQRFRSQKDAKPIVIADILLGMFLMVLTASTLTHDWKYSGGQPVARLLFLNLLPAVLYWMVRQIKITDAHIGLFLKAAVGFGVYLALTGIAEVSNLHSLVFPRYIVSPDHTEFFGRARGPYLNPVANGLYLATCLACAWMLWPRCRDQVQRTALLGISCLIGIGAVATLTRCVWLGVAGSVASVVWLTFPKTRRLGALLVMCSVTGLGLGVAGSSLNAFKRDKNVSVSDMSKSASLRPMLAAVAWQMFEQHPIAGVGFGQYTQVDDDFIATRSSNMPLDQVRPYHQHNFILALLTETGLAGLVPFLVLLAAWARIGVRLWEDRKASLEQRQVGLVFVCCLLNYVVSGAFHDVLLIPMNNALLFLMAGMSVSIAQDRRLLVPVLGQLNQDRRSRRGGSRSDVGQQQQNQGSLIEMS